LLLDVILYAKQSDKILAEEEAKDKKEEKVKPFLIHAGNQTNTCKTYPLLPVKANIFMVGFGVSRAYHTTRKHTAQHTNISSMTPLHP